MIFFIPPEENHGGRRRAVILSTALGAVLALFLALWLIPGQPPADPTRHAGTREWARRDPVPSASMPVLDRAATGTPAGAAQGSVRPPRAGASETPSQVAQRPSERPTPSPPVAAPRSRRAADVDRLPGPPAVPPAVAAAPPAGAPTPRATPSDGTPGVEVAVEPPPPRPEPRAPLAEPPGQPPPAPAAGSRAPEGNPRSSPGGPSLGVVNRGGHTPLLSPASPPATPGAPPTDGAAGARGSPIPGAPPPGSPGGAIGASAGRGQGPRREARAPSPGREPAGRESSSRELPADRRPPPARVSGPARSPERLIDAVAPAVVRVRTRAGEPGRSRRPGGFGFIVDDSGYIVTNNRVVSGTAAVEVTLADGRTLPAVLIGRDPLSDLAILKVEATRLPTIALGDSSTVRVGDPVVAVGRRGGRDRAAAVGRITATGWATGGDLATDVPMSRDSSGTPLINLRGEAIGIARAADGAAGGSATAGFAVPIDRAKPILRDLKKTGRGPAGWPALPSDR